MSKFVFVKREHSLHKDFTVPWIVQKILKYPFATYGPTLVRGYFRSVMKHIVNDFHPQLIPIANKMPAELTKLIGMYLMIPLLMTRNKDNEEYVHFFVENDKLYVLYKGDETQYVCNTLGKYKPHPNTLTQHPHVKIHEIRYTWIEQPLTTLLDSGITEITIAKKSFRCERGNENGWGYRPRFFCQVGIISSNNAEIFDSLMKHANSDTCASLQASAACLLKDKSAGGSGLSINESPSIYIFDIGSAVSNVDGIKFLIKNRGTAKFNTIKSRQFTDEYEVNRSLQTIISRKQFTDGKYIVQLEIEKFDSQFVTIEKNEICFVVLGTFVCDCVGGSGTLFQINCSLCK